MPSDWIHLCYLLLSSNLDKLDKEIAKAEWFCTTLPHNSFSRLAFKTSDRFSEIFGELFGQIIIRKVSQKVLIKLAGKVSPRFSNCEKYLNNFFCDHYPFTLGICCQNFGLDLSDWKFYANWITSWTRKQKYLFPIQPKVFKYSFVSFLNLVK